MILFPLVCRYRGGLPCTCRGAKGFFQSCFFLASPPPFSIFMSQYLFSLLSLPMTFIDTVCKIARGVSVAFRGAPTFKQISCCFLPCSRNKVPKQQCLVAFGGMHHVSFTDAWCQVNGYFRWYSVKSSARNWEWALELSYYLDESCFVDIPWAILYISLSLFFFLMILNYFQLMWGKTHRAM